MNDQYEKNKSLKRPPGNPQPAEIKAAREAARLSQSASAELIHSGLRTWQQWESGDRRMHPAFWELFRIKIATLVEHVSKAS